LRGRDEVRALCPRSLAALVGGPRDASGRCLSSDGAFHGAGRLLAIEDAVVLGRALDGVDVAGVAAAFQNYENARKERTARVQIGSRGNEWLKQGGNADWVYGYVASKAPVYTDHLNRT
jgi:hypothetical protein